MYNTYMQSLTRLKNIKLTAKVVIPLWFCEEKSLLVRHKIGNCCCTFKVFFFKPSLSETQTKPNLKMYKNAFQVRKRVCYSSYFTTVLD